MKDASPRKNWRSMRSGLVCLTGGEEGPLAHALGRGGIEGGIECVRELCRILGRENVYVELQRHLHRDEEARNQAAVEIARQAAPAVAGDERRLARARASSGKCWMFSLRFAIT